jgi:GT2 family glycosyltransferase
MDLLFLTTTSNGVRMNSGQKILVIVPLFKNATFIETLFSSIASASNDFLEFDTKFLFINDSPDDIALRSAITAQLPNLPKSCNADLIINETNIGFIASANLGLERALAEGRDAILLNSDALLTPGAISELAKVAYLDPLIGFVSPRSNNATICNSPYPEKYRGLDMEAALSQHRQIEPFLPRITYVPTAVGFCLYIRNLMLREFGLFDMIYGQGYNEENDLIMRCNHGGYRAVLANRAFVYHVGEMSFSQTSSNREQREETNRRILLKRYPEYEFAVQRFFQSVEYRAQSLVSGLIPDQDGRLRILFECSHLICGYSGTYEFAKKLIAAFVAEHQDDYQCFIRCSEAAYRFHGYNSITGLTLLSDKAELDENAPFAMAIRLAQPFLKQELVDINRLAPITAFIMLDTIAQDCEYIETQDLKRLWDTMLQTTAVIGYNSLFSKAQFHLRHAVPDDVTEFTALHSMESADYAFTPELTDQRAAQEVATTALPKNYILLVGNHYAHKALAKTIALFRQIESPPPIVVLGIEVDDPLVCASYRSGELSDAFVYELYQHSRCVLFPSHYEGFGFPIMHALACHKPVIARDLPSALEIKAEANSTQNMHLFATTREMVAFACESPSWINDAKHKLAKHNWSTCAKATDQALRQAIAEFQFSKLCDRLNIADLVEADQRAPAPKSTVPPNKLLKILASIRHPFSRANRQKFKRALKN